MQVTVHEAKTHLSRLIEAVLAGEEVIIARRDRPVVRLERFVPAGPDRMAGFGCLKGRLPAEAIDRLTGDEELDREVEEAFAGTSLEPGSAG